MEYKGKLVWKSITDVDGSYYREVLVMKHKHSSMDWEICAGRIFPIDNYKDFKVSTYAYRDVSKEDILLIGEFTSYGDI